MGTRHGKTILFIAMDGLFILAMVFALTAPVRAATTSPFTGEWFATDIDGGVIRLTIAGPPNGPFKITWTEDSISFCGGKAGIVKGVGWLNPENPNRLEADLRLICLASGESLNFQLTWRYEPGTDMLSSSLDGFATLWHRPGLSPTYPPFNLRVNYGDNWVESFYEAGHSVWVTVFSSDLATVKATGEFWTEPKEYWGWESGFQSMDSVWYDSEGNPMPNPPDIRPYDWVYGWVDNGASTRVQIGDIRGIVDLETDSIAGTILATWFSAEVSVECFPWGSPDPTTAMKFDSILPDGLDAYACSWADEWDIQNGQTVGVGYFGADGNWVSNAFRNPRFTVFPEWNALEGWEWPEGMPVTASIEGKSECTSEGTPGYLPDNPWSTFFWIDFPQGCDVAAGDVLTLASGDASLTHTVRDLAVTEVSPIENWVLGTSAPDANLHVWAHGYDAYSVYTTADDGGNWGIDFDDTGFDLQEGMSGRAQIDDELGNATAVDWLAPVTYFVSSTADVLADDGVCTLREAVIAANTNAPSGSMQGECQAGLDPVPDTILLAPDQTYSLIIDSTYEDSSLDGDLDVWDNSAAVDLILKVDQGGRATISQDAAVDDRVLQNHGAGLQIENLTLRGGNEGGIGGGILNTGGLTLNAVEVSGNTAGWSGGGIYTTGGAWLDATDCSISNNIALNSGAGGLANDGQATLTGCSVSDNVGNFDGGGIHNTGVLTIDSSLLAGNSSTGGGGALSNAFEGTAILQNGSEVRDNTADVTGGGLFNYGTLEVSDSTIEANTAGYGGGLSLWAGNVTLANSILNGNTAPNDGGGIHVTGSGTLSIEKDSEITSNASNASGGGIAVWDYGTVHVKDSLIAHNTAGGTGGGVANLPNGTLTIDASTISDNAASDCGGLTNRNSMSITNSAISNNQSDWGGGLCAYGGALVLDASTVSGNTAVNDAGGLFIRDAAIVNVQNGSQIVDNSANWGGGISSWGSTLTIDASTIAGNSVNNSGGGILLHEGGSATIQNGSFVSNNTANWGAGISNWNAILILTDSTLSGNAANYTGGGLENGGALIASGSAFLGNTAGGNGDAVWSWTDIPAGTTVTDSCIAGNGAIAVFTIQPVLQNFSQNWWGDPSGPGGAGPGLGDTVGPYIDFADWLGEAPAICAAP